jgi:hypothetical protein
MQRSYYYAPVSPPAYWIELFDSYLSPTLLSFAISSSFLLSFEVKRDLVVDVSWLGDAELKVVSRLRRRLSLTTSTTSLNTPTSLRVVMSELGSNALQDDQI